MLWHAGSAEEEDVYLSVLQKAFNDLGYIVLEHRCPAENPERFRAGRFIDRDLDDAVRLALRGLIHKSAA